MIGKLREESVENVAYTIAPTPLFSRKLGKKPDARDAKLAQVLTHLVNIDLHLESTEMNILGDAYEYLIGQLASGKGAGKKVGKFYKMLSTNLQSTCHLPLAA
ncbi:hypothetical protein MCT07_14185 [Vibrio aestuarianus]|nr:hypothetical protein [Vibrio aestuarianus]MDE1239812.1 hypothetical protein [Vibrio aestuarianus]